MDERKIYFKHYKTGLRKLIEHLKTLFLVYTQKRNNFCQWNKIEYKTKFKKIEIKITLFEDEKRKIQRKLFS